MDIKEYLDRITATKHDMGKYFVLLREESHDLRTHKGGCPVCGEQDNRTWLRSERGTSICMCYKCLKVCVIEWLDRSETDGKDLLSVYREKDYTIEE